MTDVGASGDWDPVLYDLFKHERQRPVHDLLAKIRPGRGGTAVDLGCGTGEYTAWLHQRSGADKTIGIDSSESMLEAASAHATDSVEFIQGDLRTVTGTHAVVFSNAALQWVPDQRAALADICEHLAVGGQLAVQVPANFDHPSHVVADEIGRAHGLDPLGRDIGALTPSDYATTLWGLELADIDVTLRVYGMELARTDQVIDWVSGTLLTSFRRRLSSGDYASFLAEYRTELLRRLGDPSGARPYFYAFPRILFTARRPF